MAAGALREIVVVRQGHIVVNEQCQCSNLSAHRRRGQAASAALVPHSSQAYSDRHSTPTARPGEDCSAQLCPNSELAGETNIAQQRSQARFLRSASPRGGKAAAYIHSCVMETPIAMNSRVDLHRNFALSARTRCCSSGSADDLRIQLDGIRR